MIKSILLATDGSDHAWAAWQYAIDIARAYDAWLRVLSVVDIRVLQPPTMASADGFIPGTVQLAPNAELEEKMLAEHNRILDETRRKTESAGIRVEVRLAHGVPPEMICAHEALVDLIAMGHHGNRSPLERLLSGSVADAVARKSSRPVLVSPGQFSPIARILAAYDGSEPSKRALHWAADLAATTKLPMAVIHVNPSRELGDMVLFEAREYLKPYKIHEVQMITRRGSPAQEILETATERGAGLIVMGAHGHSRIRETLIGSITETMLHRTDRPLLMTR